MGPAAHIVSGRAGHGYWLFDLRAVVEEKTEMEARPRPVASVTRPYIPIPQKAVKDRYDDTLRLQNRRSEPGCLRR